MRQQLCLSSWRPIAGQSTAGILHRRGNRKASRTCGSQSTMDHSGSHDVSSRPKPVRCPVRIPVPASVHAAEPIDGLTAGEKGTGMAEVSENHVERRRRNASTAPAATTGHPQALGEPKGVGREEACADIYVPRTSCAGSGFVDFRGISAFGAAGLRHQLDRTARSLFLVPSRMKPCRVASRSGSRQGSSGHAVSYPFGVVAGTRPTTKSRLTQAGAELFTAT